MLGDVDRLLVTLATAALVAGCSGDEADPRRPEPAPSTPTTTVASPDAGPEEVPRVEPPRVSPDDARVATALAAVRHLAGDIGPRHGTSPAFRRAAAWVEGELTGHGWQVTRQRFPTPGGVSWGVPVPAGPSVNLVATRGEPRPGRPWLVIGAHLDTVPQAPGAEDNASGIGVLLAVAEALDGRRSRLPVVLVAFGSEEPRGPSDDDHHYGSRAYVASLTSAQRRSLRGMVSLDRVGVGESVPVGSPAEPNALTESLRAAARRAGVPTVDDPFQRSSDHWSFARDGLPGARLGSVPYAGYHSAGDVPAVVDRAQLDRTTRLLLAWLR